MPCNRSYRENLQPSTFRYPVEEPRELYNFDNIMNRLLRETFFHYFDLKLQGIFQDERRGAPNPTIEKFVSWPNNSFLYKTLIYCFCFVSLSAFASSTDPFSSLLLFRLFLLIRVLATWKKRGNLACSQDCQLSFPFIVRMSGIEH